MSAEESFQQFLVTIDLTYLHTWARYSDKSLYRR